MNCCTQDCRQGRDCQLRHGRITHDSDGLTVTDHYCEPAVLSPVAVWALAAIVCVLVGLLIKSGE